MTWRMAGSDGNGVAMTNLVTGRGSVTAWRGVAAASWHRMAPLSVVAAGATSICGGQWRAGVMCGATAGQ